VVDGEEDTRLLETLRPPAPFFVHLQPDQSRTTEFGYDQEEPRTVKNQRKKLVFLVC
jgi:hypothetical protein